MTDRSKEIFGNPMSEKEIKKAEKTQEKFLKKYEILRTKQLNTQILMRTEKRYN